MIALSAAIDVLVAAVFLVLGATRYGLSHRLLALGFLLQAVRQVMNLLALEMPVLQSAADLTYLLSVSLLVAGARQLCGLGTGLRGLLLLLSPAVIWTVLMILQPLPMPWHALPVYFSIAGCLLYVAWLFYRQHRVEAGAGYRVAALIFLLWGLHVADYPFLRPIEEIAAFGFGLKTLLVVSAALLFLILGYRREALAADAALARLASDAQALVDSRRKLEQVLTTIGEGVWIWDVPGQRVEHNAVWCRLLGLPDQPLVHTLADTHARLHADDRDGVLERQTAALASGQDYRSTHRMLRADGSVLWVLDRGRVVERDAQGEPRTMLGSITDISARREAEERLQAGEARWQQLAEKVPGALLRFRVAPDGTEAIEYVSAGCKSIWELDQAEIGSTMARMTAMIDPDDLPGVVASLQACAAAGRPWSYDWRIRTPSGAVKWLHGTGQPQRETSGEVLWSGLVLDITETRELEAQLAQAVKMEAIGKLTGGLAHDFNNYLGVIIGNLDLLRERGAGQGEAARYVEPALSGALKAAELTRSLLAFARRQPLDPRPCALNQRIEATVAMLQRTVGQDLRIMTELDPQLWLVLVDAAQFDSCLLNLASNARDAMPQGGVLRIRSANRSVSSDDPLAIDLPPGDHVLIEVVDDGCGMSPEVLACIFEPFFTTKGAGHGTGLGLSTVYGFVRQSGGQIQVESLPGVGTQVRIFLPRAPGTVENPPAPVGERPIAGGGATVLLVEDNAAVRMTAALQLRALGCAVLEADSGEAALRLLDDPQTPVIDLLFSDVIMGEGLDGFALAKEARARSPGLRVLLTSGFPGAESSPDPAFPLLGKPYRKDELAAAISAVLEA